MNITEIETQLESIGLNKSEIRVYFSLLKLGSSSTGPIITKSKTANSKVYEVLEKLMQKGLVSHFTKGNVKHYKAASQKMILHYLREKEDALKDQEKNISSIMPQLLRLAEKEEENETSIFTGPRGIKTAFRSLVDELSPNEEVHIMGVHDLDEKFLPLALFFQNIRSHKKIKAKFLMNAEAKEIAKQFKKFPPVEIRYLPENLLTPAIFLIYGDKVIINLAKEQTFFVIKSKGANLAFESYFQLLWKQSKK